ncbi:hypothetical protein Mal48_26390 [Thalassoglobus polymorphus]|uniref:Uncharacterized protein n=1 Tax=Thalassoglobus polymorphus TaxID=2527994 RepID=A0A517QP33_9PLAN|nr:hypothetical protein Mal48_26390 [Thalassoglobus polymorphus]
MKSTLHGHEKHESVLELTLKPEITLSSIEKSGDSRVFRTGSKSMLLNRFYRESIPLKVHGIKETNSKCGRTNFIHVDSHGG